MPHGSCKEVHPMIGPHIEESQEKAEQEETTFAWDEASILI